MKVKENHQMDEEDDDIFTFERSPSPPPAPSVVKNKSDTSLAGTFKPSKGKRPMREPDSDDEDIQAATPSNKRSKVDDAPKQGSGNSPGESRILGDDSVTMNSERKFSASTPMSESTSQFQT